MRISDWSSDVCSSDLHTLVQQRRTHRHTMATFQTYDSVGAKEDVSDVISMLTPHKVPFSTSIGSETVKQKVYQWQEDELDPAQDNAQVEGFDATEAELTTTEMLQNTTQTLSRTIKLSGSLKAPNPPGRANELARQLASGRASGRERVRQYVRISG